MGHGRRRICVTFDSDLFECVAQRAVHSNSSFSEEAVTLIEWGLESAAQDDAP